MYICLHICIYYYVVCRNEIAEQKHFFRLIVHVRLVREPRPGRGPAPLEASPPSPAERLRRVFGGGKNWVKFPGASWGSWSPLCAAPRGIRLPRGPE